MICLNESPQRIYISTSEITLGQFLKLTNIFPSGGTIKRYLQDHGVFVNGTLEKRRGGKLQIGDIIKINDRGTFIVKKGK